MDFKQLALQTTVFYKTVLRNSTMNWQKTNRHPTTWYKYYELFRLEEGKDVEHTIFIYLTFLIVEKINCELRKLQSPPACSFGNRYFVRQLPTTLVHDCRRLLDGLRFSFIFFAIYWLSEKLSNVFCIAIPFAICWLLEILRNVTFSEKQ